MSVRAGWRNYAWKTKEGGLGEKRESEEKWCRGLQGWQSMWLSPAQWLVLTMVFEMQTVARRMRKMGSAKAVKRRSQGFGRQLMDST
jgi:hypothetical protein